MHEWACQGLCKGFEACYVSGGCRCAIVGECLEGVCYPKLSGVFSGSSQLSVGSWAEAAADEEHAEVTPPGMSGSSYLRWG